MGDGLAPSPARCERLPHRRIMPTLDRIAVSTWSFHTLFEAGQIAALDFPEMIADRYHVHHVEIVFPHFASTDPGYLEDFNQRLRKSASHVVNIPVDWADLWEKASLSSTD